MSKKYIYQSIKQLLFDALDQIEYWMAAYLRRRGWDVMFLEGEQPCSLMNCWLDTARTECEEKNNNQ